MILATSELEKIRHNITALNDNNIRESSIDLSIDDKAFVKKNDDMIDLFQVDSVEDLCADIYDEVDLAKGYELKPQSYLYSKSVETITMPNTMCGIVLPRSSFARIGLILPISSYVNPGYNGNLPIVIFNASNSIIKIPPYIRIMQLLFCELKGEAIPYGSLNDSKYQNENELSIPKFNDKEIGEILARLKNK